MKINHIGMAVPSIAEFLSANELLHGGFTKGPLIVNEVQDVREMFGTDGTTVVTLRANHQDERHLLQTERMLDDQTRFDVVDISASSLDLARGITGDARIRYHLSDIFDYQPSRLHDFITTGEALEHVEQPEMLLAKVRNLPAPGGHVYITTPANAPMPDHIFFFRGDDKIRVTLRNSGFAIEREVSQFAADLPVERCVAPPTPLMFAAFVAQRPQ